MAKSKLKLTALQNYKLHEAMRNVGSVLGEIKRDTLTGQAKQDMQSLEMTINAIGGVLISAS